MAVDPSASETEIASEDDESKKAYMTQGPENTVLLLKEREDDQTTSEESDENVGLSSKELEEEGAQNFLSYISSMIMKSSVVPKKNSAYAGVDSWVPADCLEIAEVAEELIPMYRKVHPNIDAPARFTLKNGDFTVLTSIDQPPAKSESSASLKSAEKGHSREESLTKGELSDKTKQEKKDEKSDSDQPLHHLVITLWKIGNEDKKYTLSLFRSHRVADVVALCERCRENPDLFRVFPQGVNLKEYIHVIFNELRDHMTWKSVHIAAQIGLVEYFKNLKEKKIAKNLNSMCQPEGLSPLMIAIKNDQQETVRIMIELGADLKWVAADGSNILHHAATSSVDMVKLLWATNKCEDLLNKANDDGNSPMYIALTNGYLSICRMFSNYGGSYTAQDAKHEATPLIGAMKSGKLDETLLARILEVSPNALNETEPNSGNTVLHCAVYKKSLILLLDKYSSKVDASACNAMKQTPLHVFVRRDALSLIVTMCAYNVDIDAQDCNGNTPLHLAVSNGNVDITRALLCLGAEPNVFNHFRETPRHLAARHPNHSTAVDLCRSLIVCCAKSCPKDFIGCAFGCMNREVVGACQAHIKSPPRETESPVEGSKDGKSSNGDLPTASTTTHTEEEKVNAVRVDEGAATGAYEFELDPDTKLVDEAYAERNEARMFPHMQAMNRVKERLREIAEKKDKSNVINVLSLDGGGIKGLVTVQLLLCLESMLDQPFLSYFDWIGATSTGTYITATLVTGKSLRQCQKYYLRFKDTLFDTWTRPYDTSILEGFIRSCFGEDARMSEIKYPRIFCTTTRADTFPVQLDLCRSYRLPLSDEENDELGFGDPKDIELWRALRRSSAAPTYFSASEGKYIDGGMIANNPTLDLLSEISFWNATCQMTGNSSKIVDIGCVLSVGTGVTPICPVDPSVFEMGDLMGLLRGIKNLSLVVIDQATATEGAPITRSRSWCHSLGTPYFRLNAPLFKDIVLDSNDDAELAKIMWDAVVYAHTHRKDFEEIAALLKLIGTTEERKKNLVIRKEII